MTADELVLYIISMIAMFLAGVAGYASCMSIAASGEVEYCYIENGNFGISHLKGHRSWRMDRDVAVFADPSGAAVFAEQTHCPLRRP